MPLQNPIATFLPVTSRGLVARTHLSDLHASKREHRTARLANGGPLFQAAGGLARMVDEASDAAFPLGVQIPVPGTEVYIKNYSSTSVSVSNMERVSINSKVCKSKPTPIRRHRSPVCRATGTRVRKCRACQKCVKGAKKTSDTRVPTQGTKQHRTRSYYDIIASNQTDRTTLTCYPQAASCTACECRRLRSSACSAPSL